MTPDDERPHPTTEAWRATMRETREAAGLTQTVLARLINATQATVSGIERGEVEASQHIMAICRVLRIAPPSFETLDPEILRWRLVGAALLREHPTAFASVLLLAELAAKGARDE